MFLSSEETEGLVVLEALASRTPVVVGEIPAYREWLQDGVNCFKVDIAALRSEDSEVRVSALRETGDAIERACAQHNGGMVERGYAIACERDLRKVGESLKRVYGDVSF